MKFFLTKTLLCVIALFLTVNVMAQDQPDYIITMKGDSIPCSITKNIFSGNCKYSLAGSTKPIKISADSIMEYHITKKNLTYGSIIQDGDKAPDFMLLLEKGKINLFETGHGYQIYSGTGVFMGTRSVTTWYFSKNSRIAVMLKTTGAFPDRSRKERKELFGRMIKDKKAVYDKYMAEDDFSFEALRNIIHLYNTNHPLEPETEQSSDVRSF